MKATTNDFLLLKHPWLIKGIFVLSCLSLAFAIISMALSHNLTAEIISRERLKCPNSPQQNSSTGKKLSNFNKYEIVDNTASSPEHIEYRINRNGEWIRPNPYEDDSWHKGAVRDFDTQFNPRFAENLGLPSGVERKPLPKEPQKHLTWNETKNFPIPEMYKATKKVVNHHPFKFTLNVPNLCKKDRKDIFILAVVHTSPANFKRRMVIRETWGSQQYYNELKTAVIFATGTPTGLHAKRKHLSLTRESNQFHDIIQENFDDSYRNLTYKGVMWLKWVEKYCSRAKFVLKVDDDIFVNVFNLVKHLKTLNSRKVLPPKTLICLQWFGMKALRTKTSKWYVSTKEYSMDQFPPYCSGSAYIVPQDLVTPMLLKSYHFFWVDDLYITGLLIRNIPDAGFRNSASLYVLREDLLYSDLVEGYSVFGHMPTKMMQRYEFWRKILQLQRKILYWGLT